MRNNFEFSLNKKANELNVKLKGDFDGNSAFELLNILKKHCRLVSTAYVNTNGLRHIYPFGAAVWQSHSGELRHCNHMHLQFTGDYAQDMATTMDRT